jgi:hypothetical protein
MRTRLLLVGLLGGFGVAALCGIGTASATVPPDPNSTVVPPSTVVVDPSNGLPAAQGPLVVVPAGCVSPGSPVAVFEGEITDAVSTTARFRVTRVLSGSLAAYEVGGQVDVQYGDETRFLEVGKSYVVGVGASAATGGLVSTVREPAPLFGGDAVVGANDSDVDCVAIEDPVRTLMVDGRSVDTGVLAPLRGSGRSLLGAIMRPLAIAFGVLLALVVVKQLLFAVGRSLREMGDSDPVDHWRHHAGAAQEPGEDNDGESARAEANL